MRSNAVRIAIVGEFDPTSIPHVKTNAALGQVSSLLAMHIEATWMSTAHLYVRAHEMLSQFDGVWIAPGSPYRSMHGALRAIRYCRVRGTPLLATCGGCQHVIIEYARNVLGFRDAQHAEYNPYASNLFVIPLSCRLMGRTMDVHLEPGSRLAEIYGASPVSERYQCNFGLNPEHEHKLRAGGLVTVGRDRSGEARLLALEKHAFFVATLFVPQLTSTPLRPHPLIAAFVRSAFTRRSNHPWG